jgi:ComF family protein
MLADLLSLFFPPVCAGCGSVLNSAEKSVCTCCMSSLPRTDFHLQKDNPVERIFWGRVEVKKASAFCWFGQESKVQQLIHELKYRGKKEIGFLLGEIYGCELRETGWVDEIDMLVPVPLSRNKEISRGYNQSEWFAKGLAQGMALPLYRQSLSTIKKNGSQTFRSRYWRWKSVESAFFVRQATLLRGKNILLVDDVITSGATLEACATALLKSGVRSVSVAAIAFTPLND